MNGVYFILNIWFCLIRNSEQFLVTGLLNATIFYSNWLKRWYDHFKTMGFIFLKNCKKVFNHDEWAPLYFMLSDVKWNFINSKCCPILGTMWFWTWKSCVYKSYKYFLAMNRHKKSYCFNLLFFSNHSKDKHSIPEKGGYSLV